MHPPADPIFLAQPEDLHFGFLTTTAAAIVSVCEMLTASGGFVDALGSLALSVAPAALQGRCKDRPELVQTPIPLAARLEVLPVRGNYDPFFP
jgi:hypothetical protein